MDYARHCGIGDRILFAGYTDDVGHWINAMDVFMLLSQHEGLPNVLIEAQLLGKPVVATAAGGSPEAVCPCAADLIVPNSDDLVAQYAVQKVVHLAASQALRAQIGEEARKWASETFAMERMITATRDVLTGRA